MSALAARIRPFQVRGLELELERLTLWDARTPDFPRPHYHAAGASYQRLLQAQVLDLHRAGTDLCGRDELALRRGDRARDESDPDPELAVVQLVGFDLEGCAGGFTLYNVRPLVDSDEVLAVSAMPMPGLEVAGYRIHEIHAAVLLHFLTATLELDDGRALELAEWRFPQRLGHRWVNSPDEIARGEDTANRTIAALEAAGVTISRAMDDGTPLAAGLVV